jgi:hypothetical protein
LELVRDAKRNFRGAVAAGIKSIGEIAAAVVDRIIMAPIDYHVEYVLSHPDKFVPLRVGGPFQGVLKVRTRRCGLGVFSGIGSRRNPDGL